MQRWDINADLGEWEPPKVTLELMRWITSANIACGGHAGDEDSMKRCVTAATALGVQIGAHPGWEDRTNRGRVAPGLTPTKLRSLILRQVKRLAEVVNSLDASLHHIKLHGALYHAVERDDRLCDTYLELVGTRFPALKIYANAGGRVWMRGRGHGVLVVPEAFLDRGYQPDGSLIPRGERGAVLKTRQTVLNRVRQICLDRTIHLPNRHSLPVVARTLCVHSDTPHCVQIARWTRTWLNRMFTADHQP